LETAVAADFPDFGMMSGLAVHSSGSFKIIFGFAGTSSGVGGSGNIRRNTKDKENYIALRKVVFRNCFQTQI
jgi:hypothetical protein